MEIVIKGREYSRDNMRVSLNLLESYSLGGVKYRIIEEFWGSDGKSNKILRGIYDTLVEATLEYKRMVHNLERTLPINELETARY